uniref:prenyl transferase n=1 Tax=Timspurckia oligopyrenoides TaxID=708627 RepID=UPI001FCD0159|nr:prenyl transferase [Timspurckia oligopyrenoides]UNJ17449.1 prenyl transferase [Timspurckia oligopyrenoides]
MDKNKFSLSLIDKDLQILDENLNKMVSNRHPVLYAASEHLFAAGGKRIRPALVLLVAKSCTENDIISPAQKRLAEITEIIHTASLVHDDILDDCSQRRGVETVHNSFNTKIAVLAGDYLFAQSSWYLANLDRLEVVKSISKVISDFAEGEIRQGLILFNPYFSMQEYIEKSFYKTASLVAASCQGSAILGNVNKKTSKKIYHYGRHLGLAFQIIDDVLDLIGSTEFLGKPAGLDLENGNLTSPLLFTLTEDSQLIDYINREFKRFDDIPNALAIIKQHGGIAKAKDLACEHIEAALSCLNDLEYSESKVVLQKLAIYVVDRLS